MARYDNLKVRLGKIWQDMTRYDQARFGKILQGKISQDLARYDKVRFGKIRQDMTR